MREVRYYSFLFIIGITFFSCSKESYEAQTPTYISIDSIILSTNYSIEGSASSNITDAWVYINDDLVGVYTLPARFPTLKEGVANLKVYGGIKDNGIAATRTRYLLYDPHEEQVNLVKGETLNITPTITYKTGATFPWLEDFENASLSFLYTAGADTIINKVSNEVREGAFSGQVFLDPGMDFFEATCPAISTVPRTGSPVYLELEFKTNEPLVVGVFLGVNQIRIITLNTTTEWKKIYINLTDVINNNPAVADMKVFFGIKSDASNPFGVISPEFYVDNLKLVHL